MRPPHTAAKHAIKSAEKLLRDRLDERLYVPRPASGKTVVYEATLRADGSWQYATSMQGETVAHTVLGSEQLLKLVLPDLPKDDSATCRTMRERQCDALAGRELLGRNFVFFGHKSDHSMVNSVRPYKDSSNRRI